MGSSFIIVSCSNDLVRFTLNANLDTARANFSHCSILFSCYVVMQVGAITSGIQPGLTMVVGPPGTGKTDTAVQILNVLYHNCPSQRTLIITHSNQALNDLFEKIMQVYRVFFSYNYYFNVIIVSSGCSF